MRKSIIAISAVLALTASYVMAASTNTVTITGTSDALIHGKIDSLKFANSFFIAEDGITNKGAVLLYLSNGDTNDAVVVASTAQGVVLATNVIVHTASPIAAVTATNGAASTTDADLAFTLVAHGQIVSGGGAVLATETKTATSKTIKAAGVFSSINSISGNVTTNPGTVNISVSGAFKAAR